MEQNQAGFAAEKRADNDNRKSQNSGGSSNCRKLRSCGSAWR
jgi:hypothetical protein